MRDARPDVARPDVARPDVGRPHVVVGVETARRAMRSGGLWGAVFALYIVASESGYVSTYPTAAARSKLAVLSHNAGLAALLGPAHRLDDVAGFTSWRTVGVLTIVGALWGLLTATRLLRGEEDAGRWELYLTGRTTRSRATAEAIAGLAAGLGTIWVLTALAAIADGKTAGVHLTVSASLFLATSVVTGAALFLAVGILVAQLARSRRQANGAAAAVLGASYLLRMVADSTSGLGWLRWATPLGWPEELHPLIGSRPLALVPVAVFVAALVTVAVVIAGRRDLGAGVMAGRDTTVPHTGLLNGTLGLTARLGRGTAAGWTAGLAVLGLVLGLVAQSAATAISGSSSVEKALARLGGHRGGAASYLGFAFLLAAALVAFAAAGQVSATRSEEADGHLDHLVVRGVARTRWLAGRLAFAAGLIVVIGLVAGVAAWAGAASQHSGVGAGALLQAGINITAPALFVLGAGILTFGFRPRWAVSATYGLVSWSFIVDLLASVIKSNRLLLDSSVLTHIAPAPAADPNWTAVAWLAGLGAAAALVGVVAFAHRDLEGS